jgi:glutamate-1-semialdehyde aminotransferase
MAVSLGPTGIDANGDNVIEYNSSTGQLEIFHNNTTVLQTVSGGVQASTFTGSLNGNAATSSRLQTARTISLTGDVTGSGSFSGASAISISTTSVNSNIANGQVTINKLANGAVTTTKLANDAVTAAKVNVNVQNVSGNASITLSANAITTYIKHTSSGTVSIGPGQYDGQTINITTTGTMTLSWSAGSQGLSLGSDTKIASGIYNATTGYWYFSETVV